MTYAEIVSHRLKTVKLGAVLLLLVVFVVAFIGVLANPDALSLKPEQAAAWDVLLKTVAGAATLLTAVLAIPRYLSEREAANRAALVEARKPFFTTQQAVYMELVEVTATLSNHGSYRKAEVEDANAAFWRLYWGQLPLIADTAVGAAVNDFENELCSPDRDDVKLRNLSMKLAKTCAASLGFRQEG